MDYENAATLLTCNINFIPCYTAYTNMNHTNLELEVRFLDIDVPALHAKLRELGAKDLGEDLLKEIIFYDKLLTWKGTGRFVRLRKTKKDIVVSYKHKPDRESLDTKEIEMEMENWDKTKLFLEAIGLVAFREQEKKRYTYLLENVTIDIDTWPSIPTYVEIEGQSKKDIQHAAKKLGLSWRDAVFAGAGYVIEHYYNIPVTSLKYFTFEKIM